jgi:hypothetical protein
VKLHVSKVYFKTIKQPIHNLLRVNILESMLISQEETILAWLKGGFNLIYIVYYLHEFQSFPKTYR